MAQFLNKNPEVLQEFFGSADSLRLFAGVHHMLEADVRSAAARIASRLIIKIARQIADTGYRSGSLKLVRGFFDGAEIELDNSTENYLAEPLQGVLPNIVSYVRNKERTAFVLMIDQSYSMKGMKVVLAAITAAAVVCHFRGDCAVLSFSTDVTVLKRLGENNGPERVLEKLFEMKLLNGTNISKALQEGFKQVVRCERKIGLLLTDGAWTEGSPLKVAALFDKLSVIGFPPAKIDRIKQLAVKGKGDFTYAEKEEEIAAAILKCLY